MSRILGVNTRWLPSPYPDLNRLVGYCVVLVAGEIDDYAAYSGVVRGESGRPMEDELAYIVRHGDKIPFEEAQAHFPNSLTRARYRD